MSPRGGKLSKRDPEVVPTLDYSNQGILPEALINFMAFIGWNPGDEKEIMSKEDLINEFNLPKVQKGSSVFNIEKLHWINKQYLGKLSDSQFGVYIENLFKNFKKSPDYNQRIMNAIIPIIRERTHYLGDVQSMIDEGGLDFYFTHPEIDTIKIIWKKGTAGDALRHLEKISEMINSYSDDWSKEILKDRIFPYADEVGRGDVLWPLRFSLSGRNKSPDPFTLLEILGKEISLERIQNNIKALKETTV
jgi:glutamyl/glutaminyl-tRNA synthetase